MLNKDGQSGMCSEHDLKALQAFVHAWPASPFPKPTPEVLALRKVSQRLYEAWEETQNDSTHEPLPYGKVQAASQIAWDAYVAVRKLLGDNVK